VEKTYCWGYTLDEILEETTLITGDIITCDILQALAKDVIQLEKDINIVDEQRGQYLDYINVLKEGLRIIKIQASSKDIDSEMIISIADDAINWGTEAE
jgi:hypothetical protein